MEVAGLAVGVAGLSGLFACCSSAFRLVQQGRTFSKDYKILETKFGNQELRLRAWGRACGLIDGTHYNEKLSDPELHQQLEATLECIKLLLGDAKELKERYGLSLCPRDRSEGPGTGFVTSTFFSGAGETNLGRRASLSRLLSRRSRLQRNGSNISLRNESPSTLATAHWIIEDRERFSELVKHLKDLIDDLEDLTKATEIPRRQLVFVEYEIESINDVETLEDMESAREGDDDTVSDAASARLERLSQGTVSTRSSLDGSRSSFVTLQSFVTLESLESYFTARTHISSLSSVVEPDYHVPTAEFHRITRYKPYGEQAISNKLLRLQARPRDPRELLHNDQFGDNDKASSRIKCVVVGEISARKTELLSCFALGGFPTAHTPLVFKEYVTECNVDGHMIDLTLWDTTGQEDYDQLRRNAYSGAEAVIVCFLIDPIVHNYDQVRWKWMLEARERCAAAGHIIVGIEPHGTYRTSRIDIARGKRLAVELDALHYIQCNLETGAGVDDVFEAATRAAIRATLANNTTSRGWKLPWRGDKRRLSVINENSAIDQTGSESNTGRLVFARNRAIDKPSSGHSSLSTSLIPRHGRAPASSSYQLWTANPND